MVPVNFSNNKAVMDRYGELFTIFQDWLGVGQARGAWSPARAVARQIGELLSEMAKVLSIKIDQLNHILRAAYHPRGWA